MAGWAWYTGGSCREFVVIDAGLPDRFNPGAIGFLVKQLSAGNYGTAIMVIVAVIVDVKLGLPKAADWI